MLHNSAAINVAKTTTYVAWSETVGVSRSELDPGAADPPPARLAGGGGVEIRPARTEKKFEPPKKKARLRGPAGVGEERGVSQLIFSWRSS